MEDGIWVCQRDLKLMVHAFNLHTMDAEAGGSLWIQDKPGQHSEFQTG